MIIPVRCFTCGKVIGDKWNKYKELTASSTNNDTIFFKNKDCVVVEAFEKLGLKRICCKRMFLGHVENIDNMLKHGN